MQLAALVVGGLSLRRAEAADLDAVVAVQRAAYARNRVLLGVEPIPLQADYRQIFADYEVWLAEDAGGVAGVLILQPRPGDLLIWSIATDLARRSKGLGRALLAAAEARARELGHECIRLYTGTKLEHLVGWYGRHGYALERIEELSDRSVTHMIKHLGCAHGEKIDASKAQ